METLTGYNPALIAGKATATALSGTETNLLTITDTKYLKSSQLSIYLSVTLGAVASATFYYYFSPDNGTTYHPVSLYNTSTGEITQRSVLVDSGTYSTGGVSLALDNVPMAAGTTLKITGKSASGTPAFALTVLARDN